MLIKIVGTKYSAKLAIKWLLLCQGNILLFKLYTKLEYALDKIWETGSCDCDPHGITGTSFYKKFKNLNF